jgi:hypothetical protein
MFLRVSGTLRNPPGLFYRLSMGRTKTPGTYRIEILLTPEGHSRLKAIKKQLRLRNQNEVIETLLLNAIGEEKSGGQLTEQIAENVLLILERLDQLA